MSDKPLATIPDMITAAGSGHIQTQSRTRLFSVGGQRSWTADERDLLLHGELSTLPDGLAVAVEAWLLDHGIDPETLVPGLPVTRDARARKVTWWEAGADGAPAPRSFLRFGDRSVSWPAPFPVELQREAC